MIDIHHHLLPGLDDGPPDLETSISMARLAASQGITHIVCTPHANSQFAFRPDLVGARLTQLREALIAAKVPVVLASGCDFHLSYDNIQDALAHNRKYTIAQGSYLLVELPDFGLSPNLAETFHQLRLAGMTPILTHPERNPTLQNDPARLAEWLRGGLLVQVTCGSVLGDMGKAAQRLAEQLLAKRWVHFLATDAHNITRRPPRMSDAHALVAKRYSPAYADLLCLSNPLAVFEDTPLTAQFHPIGQFSDASRDSTDSQPFWKRLFSRK